MDLNIIINKIDSEICFLFRKVFIIQETTSSQGSNSTIQLLSRLYYTTDMEKICTLFKMFVFKPEEFSTFEVRGTVGWVFLISGVSLFLRMYHAFKKGTYDSNSYTNHKGIALVSFAVFWYQPIPKSVRTSAHL